MSSSADKPPIGPVVASFRFGPSVRLFTGLWWLLGPVPFVVLLIRSLQIGDFVDLGVFVFLWLLIGPAWGLALWRGRIDITDRLVIVRRLRPALHFDRATTTIRIANAGGTPVANVTDKFGTRRSYAVTAMRTDGRKLRELASYVPVTMFGKRVEPAE